MLFRSGVNLGDIVEDGERIYGDGVNITARVEGLAEGGGICVSAKVHEEVEGKLGLEYEYLGPYHVQSFKVVVGRCQSGNSMAFSKVR